jgi:5'-3' exonuclease
MKEFPRLFVGHTVQGMGVFGLLSYCRPIQTYANMKQKGLRIGVDGLSVMYLFRERREALCKYFEDLLALEHHLHVVLDKRANKAKKVTLEARKEQRSDAKKEAEKLQAMIQSEEFQAMSEKEQEAIRIQWKKKQRDAWTVYSDYMKWFLSVLEGLSIPVEIAPEEADEVLAIGNYDCIISCDSDILLHGCQNLWIPRGIGIQHNEILSETFHRFLGLSMREELSLLAFLAGCDVQPRQIVPFKVAVSWIRFYGSLERMRASFPDKVREEDLYAYAKFQSLFYTN